MTTSHRNSQVSLNSSFSQPSVYVAMSRYRCCCGMLRLRVGACLIGVCSIAISIFGMCSLLTFSGHFSREMQFVMTLPLSALVLFQTASAMLLIIGILIDTHSLLIPYIGNCILHILLSIGGTILLLIFRPEVRHHCPLVVIGACFIFMVYLWFGSVVAMTFIVIRDKKGGRGSDFDEIVGDLRERGSSSFI